MATAATTKKKGEEQPLLLRGDVRPPIEKKVLSLRSSYGKEGRPRGAQFDEVRGSVVCLRGAGGGVRLPALRRHSNAWTPQKPHAVPRA